MIDPQRVHEASVDGSGVHEVGEAELLNATQTLELRGVDDSGGNGSESDVLPDRIADGPNALGGGGRLLDDATTGAFRERLSVQVCKPPDLGFGWTIMAKLNSEWNDGNPTPDRLTRCESAGSMW